MWAAHLPCYQKGCKYSQTSRSYQTPQASFGNFTHLWKLFQGKNFPKECCIMLLIRFSDCFIATPEFQIFSAKSIIRLSKSLQVFSWIIIDGKTFQVRTKTEVAVHSCSIKKLFWRGLTHMENTYARVSF